MNELVQNVGEFEGVVIANEPTRMGLRARLSAQPDDATQLSQPTALTNNLLAMVHQMVQLQYFVNKNNNLNTIPTVQKDVGQLCACLRRQTSDLSPSPPPPRIRGACPKYLPHLRPKELCN
jgi:hypothetical protein